MMNELTANFLLDCCVPAEELKTNFRINFIRFSLSDYHKIRTEEVLSYAFYPTRFGEVIIGSTSIGICYLHFVKDRKEAERNFKAYFPDCAWKEEETKQHKIALKIINEDEWPEMLNLQVKGTDFQYKVWRGITKIALGQLTTYSELAKNIGVANGSRAVGSAIGSNEIAYLIPCHRIIQKTGKMTGFRWGDGVKYNLLMNELVEKNKI